MTSTRLSKHWRAENAGKMIDWIKFEAYPPEPDKMRKRLDFMRPVNTETGEVFGTHEAAFLRIRAERDAVMKLQLFPSGRLLITGSLHKFYHGVNHTDFLLSDLFKSISSICEAIGIAPVAGHILQMEYGVNIRTPFAPKELLSRLICMKYRSFNAMKPLHCIGRDCYIGDWGVKIYDKGKQYGLPDHLLRMEKKVTNSRFLRKMNIQTLADFTPAGLERLVEDFVVMFRHVLVNDRSIKDDSLTGRQRLALANYRNPGYWEVLSRHAAHNARKRFDLLIGKYGNETYLNTVLKLTEAKASQLIASGDIYNETKPIMLYGKDPPILPYLHHYERRHL